MPDLNFSITGIEPAARSVTPLLHFKLSITTGDPADTVHAIMLHAQIQIDAPQRQYNQAERDKLIELFGQPEAWGQTLRSRFWTHANASVTAFTGGAETILPVPCTYDLNVAAAKYFYALEDGDVPLSFLFSGSVFYQDPARGLQVAQIPWDKECSYRMPVAHFREALESLHPNSTWLYLRRDLFDALYAYRRREGFLNWEQTIEQLLAHQRQEASA